MIEEAINLEIKTNGVAVTLRKMYLVRGKACRVAVAFTFLLLCVDLPVWSADDTQSIKVTTYEFDHLISVSEVLN